MKLFISILLFIHCYTLNGSTLIFSPPVRDGSGMIITYWSEGGFEILGDPSMASFSANVQPPIGGGFRTSNGTDYLIFGDDQSNTPIVAQRNGAGGFQAVSVDLGEFSSFYSVPKAVIFIGTLSDNSTVTTTFITDGFLDGVGGLPDFETFYFPQSFNNLLSLSTFTNGFAMDNLSLQAVPESNTASLLVCALLVGIALYSIKFRLTGRST